MGVHSRRLVAAIGVAASFGIGVAASRRGERAPDAMLAPLGAYLGEWSGTGTLYDTPYSRSGKVTSDTRCTWSPHSDFFVCDQVNEKDGAKTASLAVYTRAATDSAFRFYGIDRAGGAPRQTELVIAGNHWTYRSGFQAGSTHVAIRTVNTFESPSSVSFQTEFSTDGSTWTRMADGHSARLRP